MSGEKKIRKFGVGRKLRRVVAMAADGVMCEMMNQVQWRLRHMACGAKELELYLAECAGMERGEYFAVNGVEVKEVGRGGVVWQSAVASGFEDNDIGYAEVYWGRGEGKPTVFLLHALMSAHPWGYRRLAARFMAAGWNAVFVHLPFHYRRKPRGYPNGALAVTANLVRNAEALRQAVIDVRTLRRWFWERGSRRFGLVGTSYGGWVGALASSVEEWDFMVLVQPVSDVEHVIWESPAARSIRRILGMQGIAKGVAERHGHLTSPVRAKPQCEKERMLLCGGEFDQVTPLNRLRELGLAWGGVEVKEVEQGHFGYSALRVAAKWIFERL